MYLRFVGIHGKNERTRLQFSDGTLWLMPTSGAYRLFAWYSEQDVSPGHVLFVQNKQAVSPQSGHQLLIMTNDRRGKYSRRVGGLHKYANMGGCHGWFSRV